jgi:anaerobic magnesium-protoporphyrin IX monomethyl ester cyclase
MPAILALTKSVLSDISAYTELDMKVLLVNPPYQTLTANLGVGHQVPLGLLMVGGALIDAGHEVDLLDAECCHLSIGQIVSHIRKLRPQIVMSGHAGSTPAHPTCANLFRAIKAAFPEILTIYGGVYPTYHARPILNAEPRIDFIVRGEGEATAVELVGALAQPASHRLDAIEGIAFRDHNNQVCLTAQRSPIKNLDLYRVGWELIKDWDQYRCFGLGRAVVLQLSRGCPHRCTYCGQHGFWVNWRHRDPVAMVDELQWLAGKRDVRFVTLADENPTTLRKVWEPFLRELASRQLPIKLFATIRASDIVRDEAILHLYREAGLLYVLMGVDTTDANMQQKVRKNSTAAIDARAAQLLRRHGIFAMLAHIVGFEDERVSTYRAAYRALAQYDGDFLNAMYVTPHSWTEFALENARRRVIRSDLRHWDYRHQVLEQKFLQPWQVFLAVKLMEFCFHTRPARWRAFLMADRFRKRQLLWCLWHTGLVWFAEIIAFIWAAFDPHPKRLREFFEDTNTPTPVPTPEHRRVALS